jgi:hypothetical protein
MSQKACLEGSSRRDSLTHLVQTQLQYQTSSYEEVSCGLYSIDAHHLFVDYHVFALWCCGCSQLLGIQEVLLGEVHIRLTRPYMLGLIVCRSLARVLGLLVVALMTDAIYDQCTWLG